MPNNDSFNSVLQLGNTADTLKIVGKKATVLQEIEIYLHNGRSILDYLYNL